MPRPPRHQEPYAYYHVASRGNDKQIIFDDVLRSFFLARLAITAERYEWRVLAHALMRNHFHFVLRLGERGLSDGMCELNNAFARASNARFGRINHCFGQRFWSAHLETEHHLLNSIRYAMWNPPRAGRCADPSGSRWTSYRASVGLDPQPSALAVADLLALFDRDPTRAQRSLSAFVLEGHVRCQAPWEGPPST
jgi:putative transposase